MGDTDFHKNGQVFAHFDKDRKILALEIPKASFECSNITVPEPDPPKKSDNPRCGKGIGDCCEEGYLYSVDYILVTRLIGNKSVLANVVIKEPSLVAALGRFNELTRKRTRCDAFEAIHSKYDNSDNCYYCTLYESCAF